MHTTCVLSLVSKAANRVFVFDFWQNNTSVKELDFYRNKIGNEGVKAIAKMLEVGS